MAGSLEHPEVFGEEIRGVLLTVNRFQFENLRLPIDSLIIMMNKVTVFS